MDRLKRTLSAADRDDLVRKRKGRLPRNQIFSSGETDERPQREIGKLISVKRSKACRDPCRNFKIDTQQNRISDQSSVDKDNYLSCCSSENDEGADEAANTDSLDSSNILLEGQCLSDEGWYDIRVMKFRKGECLVRYENAEDEETAWLPLKNIRLHC
jgi:hypothetical protein